MRRAYTCEMISRLRDEKLKSRLDHSRSFSVVRVCERFDLMFPLPVNPREYEPSCCAKAAMKEGNQLFFVASRFLTEPGRADATVLVIWRADFA